MIREIGCSMMSLLVAVVANSLLLCNISSSFRVYLVLALTAGRNTAVKPSGLSGRVFAVNISSTNTTKF